MNTSQVFAIAIILPIAFVALMLAVHQIRRMIPPYRQAISDATDRIPKLTNRTIRWVDIVGRDNDRLFIRVSFADATTFGTNAGPPRSIVSRSAGHSWSNCFSSFSAAAMASGA